MSENVSVLTGQTQTLAEQSVDAFNTQVLKHIYGDYDQHTQVKVYALPYFETSGHLVSNYSLRVLITHPTLGDIAVIFPCEPTSDIVVTDGPPVFLADPSPVVQTVPAGHNAQFEVFMASTTSTHLQWQKNGNDLPGQVTALLFLAAVTKADAAIYRCVATNAYGVTVSNEATLFVS